MSLPAVPVPEVLENTIRKKGGGQSTLRKRSADEGSSEEDEPSTDRAAASNKQPLSFRLFGKQTLRHSSLFCRLYYRLDFCSPDCLKERLNDRSRIAGRLMDLAIMHMVEGDLASAAHKMLEEAASVHHSLGEKYREAACLHREGEVAAWQGDLPLAQDLTSRALAIREQLDEPEYVAQTLDTIAWIELQSGNLKAAEETAAKAMAEHDRAHGPIGVGIANEVMSEALLAEGRLSEAEAAFARAQELMSPWKTGEAPVSLKVLRARLLAAHGRTSEAHREFRQAIELAKKYHTGRVLMLASFSKAELDFGLHLESSADELRRFELEAEAKGFGLFAEQARASLALSFPTTARNSR